MISAHAGQDIMTVVHAAGDSHDASHDDDDDDDNDDDNDDDDNDDDDNDDDDDDDDGDNDDDDDDDIAEDKAEHEEEQAEAEQEAFGSLMRPGVGDCLERIQDTTDDTLFSIVCFSTGIELHPGQVRTLPLSAVINVYH